jgi:hypothetical protein
VISFQRIFRSGIPFHTCIEETKEKGIWLFLVKLISSLILSKLGIPFQLCIEEIEDKYSKRFSFLRNSINFLSSSRLGIPFQFCIEEIEEKGISSLCKNFIKSIISFLLFILERREYEVPQYIEVIFAELGFLFVFKSADLFSKQKIKSYILDLSSSETFILSTLSRNL